MKENAFTVDMDDSLERSAISFLGQTMYFGGRQEKILTRVPADLSAVFDQPKSNIRPGINYATRALQVKQQL